MRRIAVLERESTDKIHLIITSDTMKEAYEKSKFAKVTATLLRSWKVDQLRIERSR